MSEKKGTGFWKKRSSEAKKATNAGRPADYKTPDDLWEACVEFFDSVERNPLMAADLVKFQGQAKVKYLPKMRVMTIGSLCIFLGITVTTWSNYRKKDEFLAVCTQVEQIIREQKFSGAAAEMLNPAIIARDLGLKDKQELTGEGGGPVKFDVTINFVKGKKE